MSRSHRGVSVQLLLDSPLESRRAKRALLLQVGPYVGELVFGQGLGDNRAVCLGPHCGIGS